MADKLVADPCGMGVVFNNVPGRLAGACRVLTHKFDIAGHEGYLISVNALTKHASAWQPSPKSPILAGRGRRPDLYISTIKCHSETHCPDKSPLVPHINLGRCPMLA
jgi:hypothetical protein